MDYAGIWSHDTSLSSLNSGSPHNVLHSNNNSNLFICRETVEQIIRSWKTKEKRKATYGRLLRVCMKSGHKSCADTIVKLMKEMEEKKEIERGKQKQL